MAEGGSGFEMKAHVGTYSRFLAFLKGGTIVTAIVVAIVVVIVAS